MFYLVAGVPRSGKSIFSKVLGKKLGITRIDFDDITMLFQEFIPEYGLFMTMNQSDRERKALPVVASLIQRYVETTQDLIIEGDNISLKDYVFYEKLTQGNLKILVFGYENLSPEEKIKINSEAVKQKNLNCWFENLEYSEKIRISQEFIDRSKELLKQVNQIDLPKKIQYFNTHQNDFEEEIKKALSFCL